MRRSEMKLLVLIVSGLILLPFNGANAAPYIGVSAGTHMSNIRKQLTYPLGGAQEKTSTASNQYTGVYSKIFAGYLFKKALGNMDIRLEGEFGKYTGKTTQEITNWFGANTASISERLNYSYGLFILPEFQLNSKNSFFAGPGFVRANLKFNSGVTGGNLGASGNHKENVNGWSVKLGFVHHLGKVCDLRLSYEYSHYQRFTITTIEPLSQNSIRSEYRPTVNSVLLGLDFNI